MRVLKGAVGTLSASPAPSRLNQSYRCRTLYPPDPRTSSEGVGGRVGPSSASPTLGCFLDLSGNGAAPVLTPRMQNVLRKALPASGQSI